MTLLQVIIIQSIQHEKCRSLVVMEMQLQETFTMPAFPENYFRGVLLEKLQKYSEVVAKNCGMRNTCFFFFWHRIHSFFDNKIMCIARVGRKPTSKNRKEKYCNRNLDLCRSFQYCIYKTQTANKTQFYCGTEKRICHTAKWHKIFW